MANTNPLRLNTSFASSQTGKQRKVSANRLLRQAHRSIQNEEGRTSRQPSVSGASIGHGQIHFSDPNFDRITTLSRAGTGPSPLEMHPGQLTTLGDLSAVRREHGSFSGPFPEPTDDRHSRTTARPPDVEEAPVQVHRSASQSTRVGALADLLFNTIWRKKHGRADAAQRIDQAPAFKTTRMRYGPRHQPTLADRQVLYVLEYDKGLGVWPHLGVTKLIAPTRPRRHVAMYQT